MLSVGGGFDCASAREMFIVKNTLVKEKMYNNEKILFANPCKTPNDIFAGDFLKVPTVTADSCEEIDKMEAVDYKPNVLLRIAIDDPSATSPFSMKFGLETGQVEDVVCLANKKGINITGLSFHVGSGSKNPEIYKLAVKKSLNIWEMLRNKGLVSNMQTLDLGGGWSSKPYNFLSSATKAFEGLYGSNKIGNIIAEPGRFFAEPTHSLYVRVVGKKPMVDGLGWRYTIDESIYGQFSCIPFDHYTPLIARVKMDDGYRRKTKALFFGRTCDSLDIIGKSVEVEELEVGDWLYIPNMGAYTTATSTEFNGFPKPCLFETNLELEPNEYKWLANMVYPLANMLDVDKAYKL